MTFVRVVIVIFAVSLAVGLAQAGCQCCPESWVPYNGYCYRAFDTPTSYFDAEEHCQEFCGSDETGHLVSIHNQEENEFVWNLWKSSVTSDTHMLTQTLTCIQAYSQMCFHQLNHKHRVT